MDAPAFNRTHTLRAVAAVGRACAGHDHPHHRLRVGQVGDSIDWIAEDLVTDCYEGDMSLGERVLHIINSTRMPKALIAFDTVRAHLTLFDQ